MNFKPTLLKTIVSLLIGVVYFLYSYLFVIHCSDLPNRPCNYSPFIDILVSLVIILITYIIWSLFGRKNKIKE